ncbi:hypothetical protein DFH28DRAFT_1192841 [Melampsora americana]|nr:hypothetical protein DFH28DRAFT_1192841 [Melampsora americana]
MTSTQYQKIAFRQIHRALPLCFIMVFTLHAFLFNRGNFELFKTTILTTFIEDLIFSSFLLLMLYLLYVGFFELFVWISARRSLNKPLEIPLQRFYPTISPPIACPWAPLINITLPTEPPKTNLPPPLHEQDPFFLRTEYDPRNQEAPKPFELIELPEELTEIYVDPQYFERIA